MREDRETAGRDQVPSLTAAGSYITDNPARLRRKATHMGSSSSSDAEKRALLGDVFVPDSEAQEAALDVIEKLDMATVLALIAMVDRQSNERSNPPAEPRPIYWPEQGSEFYGPLRAL